MRIHRTWQTRRSEPLPEGFEKQFGALLAPLLWARGFSSENDALEFLNPKMDQLTSPSRLANMDISAERLAQAIHAGEQITVYSDYDMDGMSGMALLYSFLKEIGCQKVSHYQPHRFDEGYGVHPEAIRTLAKEGAQLIITVDTGISANEAAKVARELGLTLIITDHHKQLGELPDTPFVLNPNQHADNSGLNFLSGAGMAMYLAIAVRAVLRNQGFFRTRPEPDLRLWLDYFVLGTVADHVSLVGDNRILVRAGLLQFMKSERPGIKALRQKTLPNATSVSERDLGFSVIPKLNAASRLGKAHLSTELLITENPLRAEELATELLSLNEERSRIQAGVYEEALCQANEQMLSLDPPIVVVHGAWHEGVLGVVAAKLVEKFGKPSVVLTKVSEGSLLRGSMRTTDPISCIRALEACKEMLIRYGGHTKAAGLLMEFGSIKDFSEKIWAQTKAFISELTSSLPIEYESELPKKLTLAQVEALQEASPWGTGNPEPMFLLRELAVKNIKELGGQHIRCQIMDGCTLIGFFKASELNKLKSLGTQSIDALVTPEINRFRGQSTVQLRVQYVRPSQTTHFSS